MIIRMNLSIFLIVPGPPPPGSMVIEPTVEPGTSVYVTFQRVQWQPGHDSVAGYSIYYSHVTPMGMQPEIRTTVQGMQLF